MESIFNALFFSIVLLGITLFIWFMRASGKRDAQLQQQAVVYRQMHPEARGLVSYGVERFDGVQWQFTGDVAGVTIRPGVYITLPDRQRAVVTEVYADDEVPERPSPEAAADKERVAIMVEVQGLADDKYFEQYYAQNPVILLEVEGVEGESQSNPAPVASSMQDALPQAAISAAPPNNIIPKIVFGLIMIAVVGQFAYTVYQNVGSDTEKTAGKRPVSSVTTSAEPVSLTLANAQIEMKLPKNMQPAEEQATQASYQLFANGIADEEPVGTVALYSYVLDNPEFIATETAMKNSSHGSLLVERLEKFCPNPNVSTEARIASVDGAKSAYQTAFKCEAQASQDDIGGYVVVVSTESTGFILFITAQRETWDSNAAWDGIVPSLIFKPISQ